jgi:hypothetical protein
MASLTSADVGAVDCANEMERVIYTPPTGPPQGPGPSNEIYALMGEANIFEMISHLYKELEKS